MRAVDLIVKKRDGGKLTTDEIRFFVDGILDGRVADYQAAAMCMAIVFRGLDDRETSDLTLAMMESGETLDLGGIRGFKVDKHSTGGVGDKTSMVVCPLVASLGVPVAKMSGRALGHTGGTIDKLESIPGFSVEMSEERFIDSVNRVGLALIGQTRDLAPADKVLYALRDVTGTVESIPLIASSIMSKKLACGADGIMLDVKCGAGAFMKTRADAESLATLMTRTARQLGRKAEAVITNMEQPLGDAVGNSLEVVEAIETLKGRGPADFTELCVKLSARMLVMAGTYADASTAEAEVNEALTDGRALAKFGEFVENQGGTADVCSDYGILPKAKVSHILQSSRSGYIHACNALRVGTASMLLGAGRLRKGDPVDLSAGLTLHAKVGDAVSKGDPLVTLHTSDESLIARAVAELEEAYCIGPEPVVRPAVFIVDSVG